MARFNLDRFLDLVQARAAFSEQWEALESAKATYATLGELLFRPDRRRVAEDLPHTLAEALRSAQQEGLDLDLDAFVKHVAAHENVGESFAVEHAQVILEVTAELVSDDLLKFLEARLPEDVSARMKPRPGHTPPPSRPTGGPARARSLAAGKPGSQTPLSEGRPSQGHAHSVANNPAPHSDTKVSSAPRAGGADNRLADGKPDTSTRISDFDKHGD